ncbi:alpha/beta hydrolase [Actinomyces sp. 2119]|uniref:Alpha/beta hydrolase n=1 Tax=Actinomyces lilanjuaniae TaxID=2321394 RepID=A0ABM6Z179_9ACTO|nr:MULTISPECIES: alpha/beta hydrolase [Actinomyces]AYD88999.1 alpha/beta hydrolase [Actinomyces lilanjuaniae]RJF41148.1 alpha/beta hydrolase [Actinomyces sp. 2119]
MPVIVNRPGPWTHRDLTAGGTRFHAALAGPETTTGAAGTLVLLVHGFPECWWTWRHVLPALAREGHRVAAVDLRGFGGSDRPPSDYDLATLGTDLAGVVRSLGHERVVVVGSGLGGQAAWTLPRLAPDLTAAIVPVGAPHPLATRSLRGRAVSGRSLQYLGLQVRGLAERRLSTPARMERLLRSWAAPATRDALGQAADYYAQLMARPGAAHTALQPARRLLVSRAEATTLGQPVDVPVLSVQGELDPVQPAQAYARDTHRVAGRLQQVTIRGVGHFPQEEAPEDLVRVLLPFLSEHA